MPVEIILVQGDITERRVDAVANAANSSLLGGGGVDGAIHRRDLPARWVIHTVGPVYASAEDRSGPLASCYRVSLRIADGLGARTVAFPAVSAGAYGWPLDDAARIALGTVSETETSVREARFVLFGSDAFRAFRRAHAALR